MCNVNLLNSNLSYYYFNINYSVDIVNDHPYILNSHYVLCSTLHHTNTLLLIHGNFFVSNKFHPLS